MAQFIPQSPKRQTVDPARAEFVSNFEGKADKTEFNKSVKNVVDRLKNEINGLWNLQKRLLESYVDPDHPSSHRGQAVLIPYVENGQLVGKIKVHEKILQRAFDDYLKQLGYLKYAFQAARRRGRPKYEPSSFKGTYALYAGGNDVRRFVQQLLPLIRSVVPGAIVAQAEAGVMMAGTLQNLYLLAKSAYARNAGANVPLSDFQDVAAGAVNPQGADVRMGFFYNTFSQNPAPFTYHLLSNQLVDKPYSARTQEGRSGGRYNAIDKNSRVKVPNYLGESALASLKRVEPGRLVFPGGDAIARANTNLPIPNEGAFPQFMFRMFASLVLVPGPDGIERVLNQADRAVGQQLLQDERYRSAREGVAQLSARVPARQQLVLADANGQEIVTRSTEGYIGNQLSAAGQQFVNEYNAIKAAKDNMYASNKVFRDAKTKARDQRRKQTLKDQRAAAGAQMGVGQVNYAAMLA